MNMNHEKNENPMVENILDYSGYEPFNKDQLIEAQAKTWNAWKVIMKTLEQDYKLLAKRIVELSMKGVGIMPDDVIKIMDEIKNERYKAYLLKEEYYKITRLINKRRSLNV